jgi:uncharacterized protein
MRRYLIAALFGLLATATAADFGALKPQDYLSDFAGVVDAGAARQINAYCARVEQTTGAQIALVVLPGLQGEPIEDVANLLYRKWGVGQKKTNEGVLVLLSIGDRRTRMEVGYGLEPILPDGSAGALLRDMRPALREANYGAAMAAAAVSLGEKIAASKGVSLGDAPVRPRRRPARSLPISPLMIVGGVVLLLLLLGGRRGGGGGGGGGFLAGMFLGNLMSGGGRGNSGGGFGGYDSGDGFGGFGGGDSGGGGASSDW